MINKKQVIVLAYWPDDIYEVLPNLLTATLSNSEKMESPLIHTPGDECGGLNFSFLYDSSYQHDEATEVFDADFADSSESDNSIHYLECLGYKIVSII